MLKKMKVNTIIIIGRGKCHGQLAGVHIHLNFIKNRDFLLIPWGKKVTKMRFLTPVVCDFNQNHDSVAGKLQK